MFLVTLDFPLWLLEKVSYCWPPLPFAVVAFPFQQNDQACSLYPTGRVVPSLWLLHTFS